MPADVTLNAGAGGAIIATDPTTSSEHYQLIKLAQGAVGTFTLVTTANALPVVIGSSFQGGVVSLSSQITVTATGPVTVTSGTVTATAATNPWSSAPGFNLPTVSVSSGLSQVSALQVSPTSSIAGAGLLVITSSFGLVTQSTQPITVTSGTITLSSAPTVTATAGTNPWSSAPGFNIPVVSVSSGLIQLSSQITVTATGPVTITSGTVTLSSQPGPWSSAPGFNLPVVNVSSGLVQALGVVAASSGVPAGLAFANNITTGATALSVNVKGTPGLWFGYTVYNSTAALRSVKVYNTTSAPTVGSTVSIVSYLPVPGSTGGGGSNFIFPYGVFCSNGIGYTITANAAATDTGAPGTNDVSLTLYYV